MARKRDYKAEWAARKARGLAAGKNLNEAAGKPDRDYSREWHQRIVREVATGKRPPPNPRPKSNRSPVGSRLTGARQFDDGGDLSGADKLISRLASDRRVFIYASITLNGDPEDVELFPNGGIRAGSLRVLLAGGSIGDLIESKVLEGQVHYGSNPRADPNNRRGKSPRFTLDEDEPLEIEIDRVVIQWAAP